MVTRQNTEEDMGQQVVFQLFDNPKALMITAGILGVMGVVPGMPHFAFLVLAVLAGSLAYWMVRKQKKAKRYQSYLQLKRKRGHKQKNCRGMMYKRLMLLD